MISIHLYLLYNLPRLSQNHPTVIFLLDSPRLPLSLTTPISANSWFSLTFPNCLCAFSSIYQFTRGPKILLKIILSYTDLYNLIHLHYIFCRPKRPCCRFAYNTPNAYRTYSDRQNLSVYSSYDIFLKFGIYFYFYVIILSYRWLVLKTKFFFIIIVTFYNYIFSTRL